MVGKLHNIVVFIRWTPQRRNKYFNQNVNELRDISTFMIVLDNDTRWGSTFDMIDSAIKNRERIDAFIAVTPELADDYLSEQDWEDLAAMMELLKPFKLVTMMGQEKGTRFGSIASVLWGFDFLMNQLEKARRKAGSEESQFRTACNLA